MCVLSSKAAIVQESSLAFSQSASIFITNGMLSSIRDFTKAGHINNVTDQKRLSCLFSPFIEDNH